MLFSYLLRNSLFGFVLLWCILEKKDQTEISVRLDFPLSWLRKLFFSDYGNVAKVERCHLDGSERSRIVESGTEQPTALTLDLVKKLVYWADIYLDFIAVVDYDGRNRHTIIRGDSVSKL